MAPLCSYTCILYDLLLDYSSYDRADERLSSAEYFCRSIRHHPYKYFHWEISWRLTRTDLPSYLFSSIIISFLYKMIRLSPSIVPSSEINSIHDVYDGFLIAQDCFQIFLSQRTIIYMQLFLPLGYLKQMSNGCYKLFIGNFENFFDGRSVIIW